MAATQPRRPVEMAHFVVRTHNMDATVDFYQKLLAADVVQRTERMTFLSYDHEHHRLAVALDPSALPRPKAQQPNGSGSGPAASGPPPAVCGFDHVAFTISSISDLLLGYRARKELGIKPLYCLNHGISASMYYADPDGNKVELQAQNFADPEMAKAYMQSPEFLKSPRGPSFDPDRLLQALDGGESEARLLAQMTVE
ncbi:hypothetical protein RB595_008929 [Gaeumannomyces hyphopodioides]